MTNEKAIMCLEDMKIKVPIPKAAKQARENNEALDVAIKALQSAEPKRGKWIRVGSGSLYDYYKCSECGEQPKWDCMGDNRWKIAFTDFCPNCGAKMEMEQSIDDKVADLPIEAYYNKDWKSEDGGEP